MSAEQPTIYVAVNKAMYDLVFGGAADQQLRTLGAVTFHDSTENPTPEQVIEQLPGKRILVTCWGSPSFKQEGMLDAADQLELIAHAAGSVRGICPDTVYERGIKVTSGAGAIAGAVADLNLALTMNMLRRVYEFDHLLHAGGWTSAMQNLGREIGGRRIGVVGAGYTGRCFIELLHRMEAEVWVFDPYLSEERAAEMNVRKADLLELFRACEVISMQAPVTEETKGMIKAEHFQAMPDGAIFINTARGSLLDQEAMLAELKTGRIAAALDTFDPEPLPADHEVRQLDNVLLTPHCGGASIDARKRQGAWMVDEIARFINGEPLKYQVTEQMRKIMA